MGWHIYNFQDDSIRIRCSLLAFSFIMIFLGIQSFFDLLSFPKLKIYAIVMLPLGLLIFCLTIIKKYPPKYQELPTL